MPATPPKWPPCLAAQEQQVAVRVESPMIKILGILLVCGAGLAVATGAEAEDASGGSRGQMLYETHCNECHRSEIHWRSKRLVTDWASLFRQVRRWQTNAGGSWDPGDTEAIAGYLNEHFYHFAPGDDVRYGQ